MTDSRFGATKRPIAVDLFSGAGGMSLGFEQAGFDVVAALDADPLHCATHEHNFPATAIVCRDIRSATVDDLQRAVRAGVASHNRDDTSRRVDVVIAGPPCQGFSVGGLRSATDDRNGLVVEFARMVCEIEPRYFVMENVPGLQAKAHERLMSAAIDCLEKGGYTVNRPIVVDAADVGVPQARKRLVFFGHRRGQRALNIDIASGRSAQATVWDAIGDLAEVCRMRRLAGKDELHLSERDLAQMTRSSSKYSRRLRHVSAPGTFGYRRHWFPTLLTNVRAPQHHPSMRRRFADTAQGEREPISRYLRLHPDDLAPVIRAGTGRERGSFTSPRPIHPFQDRVLTVREAARLQSFPDWFDFHVTNWHGYRQIGNAVPPMLATRIGLAVRGCLSGVPTRPILEMTKRDPNLLKLDFTGASRRYIEAISRPK